MRIGIVGSRRRTDREAVDACVAELGSKTVVITGGANGPDRWAEEAARARDLEVVVHKPDLDGALTRWQAAERFYARNQSIVDDSDMVNRIRGTRSHRRTEDTIRRAVRAGKPVEVR